MNKVSIIELFDAELALVVTVKLLVVVLEVIVVEKSAKGVFGGITTYNIVHFKLY